MKKICFNQENDSWEVRDDESDEILFSGTLKDCGIELTNDAEDYAVTIGRALNISPCFLRALMNETFDEDMGECIDHIDSERNAVYLRDISVDSGPYTMLPITYKTFVNSLLRRVQLKIQQ